MYHTSKKIIKNNITNSLIKLLRNDANVSLPVTPPAAAGFILIVCTVNWFPSDPGGPSTSTSTIWQDKLHTHTDIHTLTILSLLHPILNAA